MSKYSILYNGSQHIFRWKKMDSYTYNFYIGEIFIGQIFHMDKTWTAVPWVVAKAEYRDLSPYRGYSTRFDASEVLLKVAGVIVKEV